MGRRTSSKPQRRAARAQKRVARRRGGCAGCCVDHTERAQDCAGHDGASATLGRTGKDRAAPGEGPSGEPRAQGYAGGAGSVQSRHARQLGRDEAGWAWSEGI
jgi:hypothetical protein